MEQFTWNQFFMAPCQLLAMWSINAGFLVKPSVVQENDRIPDEENSWTSAYDYFMEQDHYVVDEHVIRTMHATGSTLFLYPLAAVAVFTDFICNPYKQAEDCEQVPIAEVRVANSPDELESEDIKVLNDVVQQLPDRIEPNEKRVNINTAHVLELMTIPSIGRTKAMAIIRYREKKGLFTTPESLVNVSGIKDKTFEKIAYLITV